LIEYHRAMAIGAYVQAWRLARRQSVEALAAKAGVPSTSLDAIESGELDPTVSTIETLAAALGIPPAWLHSHPQHLDLLTGDPDGEASEPLPTESVDPVMDRVLLGTQQERGLYVLLTALLQSGDPKLTRAAEVSLQSLVKQSKQTTVPWQTRPPGHFEPPAD
jgi:transcriptional regulator with XRE-family HTH domain